MVAAALMSASTVASLGSARSSASAPKPRAVLGGRPRVTALARGSLKVFAGGMNANSMKALGERVLVVPEKIEEKSKGGIILPGNAGKDKSNTVIGKLVSIGDGVKVEDYPGVEVGATVLCSKYSSSDVPMEDGSNAMFVAVDSILAVLGE
mmetsp:Transcript_44191/g.140635  ORF Transcript_44191/g.140635 Transcript_44191/m.140635 type:complete len:151 (+) Transcript_44191:91-543(+)